MVICQHIYKDSEYDELIRVTFNRHKSYCENYGIDYSFQVGNLNYAGSPDRTVGDWYKVIMIQRLLKEHELVIYLDADTMIYDLSFDLSTVENPPDTIGAVIFPRRIKPNGKLVYNSHYNVGALYVRNGERVQKFLEKWLGYYPGTPTWYEQGVFNDILDGTIYPLPYEYNHTSTAHPESNSIKVKGYHSATTSVWKKKKQMEDDLSLITVRNL